MKFHNKYLLFSAGIIACSFFVMQNAEASTYIEKNDKSIAQVTTSSQLDKWNFVFSNKDLMVSKREETRKITMSKSRMSKVVVSNQEVISSSSKAITHNVVKGDTLTKISKTYDIRIEELKKWNNLQSDVIYVGQALKVFTEAKKDQDKPTSPEVVVDEAVKPVEIIESTKDGKIADIENEIKKQLDSEVANPFPPSNEGQAVYEKVIKVANDQIGIQYVFGGNTPEGFDCSGFVSYVYGNAGMNIVRKSSKDYFMNDTTIVETPVIGDAVFFKDTYISGISHMGIYIGDNKFIHAGNDGVEISTLDFGYWKSKFVAFKRFNEIK